jgi:iron complex outermembrane receptor protein
MRSLLLLALLPLPSAALAQDPQDPPATEDPAPQPANTPPALRGGPSAERGNGDVVAAADDAFGRRIGIEEVGLYSEGEVRGFDLQAAGNYRIEDHYFARTSGLFVAMNAGTLIRVGANGLRTDFAAPSGVVQYDLPSAASPASLSVEAGWWGFSGPALVASYGLESADGRFNLGGGVQYNPWQVYTDGTNGTYYAGGATPRWRPSPGVEIAAVVAKSWFRRGTDTAFAVAPGQVPPRVRRWTERSQGWMEPVSNGTLTGLFGHGDIAGWRVSGSLFYSDAEEDIGYFNLLRMTGNGREAENSFLVTPDELSRAISGELKAERSFTTGTVTHRIVLMGRRRDSLALTHPGAGQTLGMVADVDDMRSFVAMPMAFGDERGRDTVHQWAAGLGYRLSIGSAIELRADAQKVRYTKQVRPIGAGATRETSNPWLYSAALAAGLSPQLTLFASYARGLEEAGVAPGNARNRGDVLPATIARQAELGAKYQIPGGPSLIAGLFDIAKPTPGLRADGVYGFVGEVRHRGVELSVAGPLTPRLSAVLGATFLDARISGELVDRGTIGPRPIGRPDIVALANLTWQVPGAEGLALDGGVSFRGERAANRENSRELAAYATLQAGVRQRFEVEGTPVTVRARVANILNQFAWNAGGSGLFFTNGPRTATLTVTGEF